MEVRFVSISATNNPFYVPLWASEEQPRPIHLVYSCEYGRLDPVLIRPKLPLSSSRGPCAKPKSVRLGSIQPDNHTIQILWANSEIQVDDRHIKCENYGQ